MIDRMQNTAAEQPGSDADRSSIDWFSFRRIPGPIATGGTSGILTCLVLAALITSPQAARAAENSPDTQGLNIVLFLVDDLGWRDLGCQGSTFYQTPHIDRLATEGVRFTDAYAACAVCSPTRAAVLTGKYPARLLLTNWLPSGRWNPKAKLREGRFVRSLPLEEQTLAEVLGEAGYRTASIGKWHLGGPPFSMPQHHGFDVNVGGNAHGAPGNYFFPYNGNWRIPTTKLRAKWNVLADGEPGEYLTDRLTDAAVDFLKNNRDQPFFLYFPHYAVHSPLQAKESLTAPYESVPKQRRQGKPVYAAMVESVDQSVGRVMAALSELSLKEKTLVIFTSDNGGFYKATSNAPLREQGFLLRRWHPRPADHPLAGSVETWPRGRRAGDQHRPLSHLPGGS